MTAKITYDEGSGFGYVRIMSRNERVAIEQTIGLKVNDYLMLDVDKRGRIVGVEFFRGEAHCLRGVVNNQRTFEKTRETYTLQLQQKPVASTYRQAGIAFHFGNDEYTDLVAIEIEEIMNYNVKSGTN